MNQAEKEAYLREYAILKSKGKQFFPYAKFLKRAYQVKKDTSRPLETLPEPVGR